MWLLKASGDVKYRLGVDYETLQQSIDLVYASISGFGQGALTVVAPVWIKSFKA